MRLLRLERVCTPSPIGVRPLGSRWKVASSCPLCSSLRKFFCCGPLTMPMNSRPPRRRPSLGPAAAGGADAERVPRTDGWTLSPEMAAPLGRRVPCVSLPVSRRCAHAAPFGRPAALVPLRRSLPCSYGRRGIPCTWVGWQAANSPSRVALPAVRGWVGGGWGGGREARASTHPMPAPPHPRGGGGATQDPQRLPPKVHLRCGESARRAQWR